MALDFKGVDVSKLVALLPLLERFIPPFVDVGGKHLDVHSLLNKILADGKLDAGDALTLLTAFLSAPGVMKPLPPVTPPRPPNVEEPEVPHPTAGKVAKIDLSAIRAVLSAKRFPKEDSEGTLQVDPNADTLNYATAVTVEATLRDANGTIISTDPGGGHQHTTVFTIECPDGTTAQIGPGTGDALVLKGTTQCGAGGKNYDNTNGTDATPRFGFADVPVKGVFKVTASESGVKSNVLSFKVG